MPARAQITLDAWLTNRYCARSTRARGERARMKKGATMHNVRKTEAGWARFRARTENGKRARRAVRPWKDHRPSTPKGKRSDGE